MQYNKKLFIIGIGIWILSSCQFSSTNSSQKVETEIPDTVQVSSLVLRAGEGLFYYKGKAFSGIAAEYDLNGNMLSSESFINGKRSGKWIKYYPDGSKSFEANYINGKKEGVALAWWSNGNLKSKSNFTNGVANGRQEQWYRSGARFKVFNLEDGLEVGLQQSWRENGKLYNNYEARNGRIFGLKRAKLCYTLDDEVVQYNMD